MTRLLTLTLTVVVWITAQAPQALSQEPVDNLDAFLSQTSALRSTGRFGARYLRRAASKHGDIAFLLHELKRQARAVEEPTKTDRAAVDQAIDEFCKGTEALISRGPALTSLIQKLLVE